MHSDILACERSAYPVLLECLKHVSHDWRRLQLVNKSMCAAFRHFKEQVDEYTAEREQMRQEAQEMAVMVQLALSDLSRRCRENGPTLNEMWADFERFTGIDIAPHRQRRANNETAWADFERTVLWPAIPQRGAGDEAAGPRMPPIIVSVHHMYANNVFLPSFVSGFRVVGPAQLATGAAVDTAVIEVD